MSSDARFPIIYGYAYAEIVLRSVVNSSVLKQITQSYFLFHLFTLLGGRAWTCQSNPRQLAMGALLKAQRR